MKVLPNKRQLLLDVDTVIDTISNKNGVTIPTDVHTAKVAFAGADCEIAKVGYTAAYHFNVVKEVTIEGKDYLYLPEHSVYYFLAEDEGPQDKSL